MKWIFFLLINILGYPTYSQTSVEVFEDAGYSGRSMTLSSDWDYSQNVSLWNQWNDRISSIKIPAGYSIQVFEDAYFGGASKVFNSNFDYSINPSEWNSWNDRISSIKILTKAPALPSVTGFNANAVDYAQGAGKFIMDRTNVWREINTGGVIYNFRETGRNEQSIYLLDDSRNISIELNIQSGQVFIFWERPQRGKLYDISKAYNTAENTTKEFANNPESPPNPPTPPSNPSINEKIRIVEVPDMAESDIMAVMQWIKNKTTGERLPFCWKQSQPRYTEGLTTCSNGRVVENLLCYEPCKVNYKGVAFLCWKNCPDGYTNLGPTCHRAVHTYSAPSTLAACPDGYKNMGASCFRDAHIYGNKCRGGCKTGYTNDGCTCRRNAHSISMNHMTCPADRFKNGGRCYVRCPEGYKNTGEFCHRDAHSIGNENYNRGVGVPMECRDGLVHNGAGLCFEPCKPGFSASSNADPVCWQQCPEGWTNCGAACAKDKTECARATTDMVVSVLELTVNVATFGLSTPATGAANATEESIKIGTKLMTSSTRVGKSMIRLVNSMKGSRGAKFVMKIQKTKFYKKSGEVYERVSQVKDAYETIEMAAENYEQALASDFAEFTSKEINDEINRRFHPKTASYLKKRWGDIQLKEMAEADGMGIAQDVLSMASLADPTGVVGAVASFTKPICQTVIPFPSLSGGY